MGVCGHVMYSMCACDVGAAHLRMEDETAEVGLRDTPLLQHVCVLRQSIANAEMEDQKAHMGCGDKPDALFVCIPFPYRADFLINNDLTRISVRVY